MGVDTAILICITYLEMSVFPSREDLFRKEDYWVDNGRMITVDRIIVKKMIARIITVGRIIAE